LLSDQDAVDETCLELSTLSAKLEPNVSRGIPVNPSGPSGDDEMDVKALERKHILSILAQVGGNRTRAVQILGISERALRYKLKAYRAQGFDV
jgi:DNA-binding NtrC family response regulator